MGVDTFKTDSEKAVKNVTNCLGCGFSHFKDVEAPALACCPDYSMERKRIALDFRQMQSAYARDKVKALTMRVTDEVEMDSLEGLLAGMVHAIATAHNVGRGVFIPKRENGTIVEPNLLV